MELAVRLGVFLGGRVEIVLKGINGSGGGT